MNMIAKNADQLCKDSGLDEKRATEIRRHLEACSANDRGEILKVVFKSEIPEAEKKLFFSLCGREMPDKNAKEAAKTAKVKFAAK